MLDKCEYPSVIKIGNAITQAWPEHKCFLAAGFADRDSHLMLSTERRAAAILHIIGSDDNLARYCSDYRLLCDRLLEEEIFFRRHGRYRLSRFEDAVAQVYSDKEFMDRYMNFLLLSHVLWANHARAMAHFEERYITSLSPGSHHLEIGPGHGLLLHFAANEPAIASVTGWDVSAASIAQTQHCLVAMGVRRPVDLVLQDLFHAPVNGENSRLFDSVVLAEVLEHLEDPVAALQIVSRHMAKCGQLWIHVPINSPAPDHLYLLRKPEEALDLVKAGGFEPIEHAFFPMTGVTLDRARKKELTISAVITARKLP